MFNRTLTRRYNIHVNDICWLDSTYLFMYMYMYVICFKRNLLLSNWRVYTSRAISIQRMSLPSRLPRRTAVSLPVHLPVRVHRHDCTWAMYWPTLRLPLPFLHVTIASHSGDDVWSGSKHVLGVYAELQPQYITANRNDSSYTENGNNLFFLRCSLIWCRSVLACVLHFMFVEMMQIAEVCWHVCFILR